MAGLSFVNLSFAVRRRNRALEMTERPDLAPKEANQTSHVTRSSNSIAAAISRRGIAVSPTEVPCKRVGPQGQKYDPNWDGWPVDDFLRLSDGARRKAAWLVCAGLYEGL